MNKIILLTIGVLAFPCFAQRVTVNRNGITPHDTHAARIKPNPYSSVKFLRMNLRLPMNWRIVKPPKPPANKPTTTKTNPPLTIIRIP